MSLEDLFKEMKNLIASARWRLHVGQGLLIRVANKQTGREFCPICAVYLELNGVEIQGSFLMPELTAKHGIPERDLVRLTHAIDGCDLSGLHDPVLRTTVLISLGASQETIKRMVRRFTN